MDVAILFNEPSLPAAHPDYSQEAGVLESVAAFGEILKAAGHQVRDIGISDSIGRLVTVVSEQRPDVVVNLCESFAGQTDGEAHVAGLLELLEIPYTGSPPECLALVHDKARAKWLLRGAGLPTAPFELVRPGDPLPKTPLGDWLAEGPLFVKPAAEDASLGVGPESVVADWKALERQVEFVASRYGNVLIEPFIDGREFEVGVVALPDPQVLPPAEVEFRLGDDLQWPIVSYEGKWALGSAADQATPVRCPADIKPKLADKIAQAALAAYRLTGCRDYARVDLRVNRTGKIFILEINANPDAGPNAGLERALAAAGIEYAHFIERLVETAAARQSFHRLSAR